MLWAFHGPPHYAQAQMWVRKPNNNYEEGSEKKKIIKPHATYITFFNDWAVRLLGNKTNCTQRGPEWWEIITMVFYFWSTKWDLICFTKPDGELFARFLRPLVTVFFLTMVWAGGLAAQMTRTRLLSNSAQRRQDVVQLTRRNIPVYTERGHG